MRALLCVHQARSWAPSRCLASSSPDNAGLSPAAPVEGASCPQQGWSLGALGPVPGLLGRPELPRRAELQHDGCARRRGEPRVEQLPGNRLLWRPTLRPLSPSQGPFIPPPLSVEPDPAHR